MAADYVRDCERCGHRLTTADMEVYPTRMDGLRYIRYRDWIVCLRCKTELLAPLNREAPNANA